MNFKVIIRHLVVGRYLKELHRSLQYNANKLGSKGLSLIFHLLLELGFDAFLTHYRENLSALPKKKQSFEKRIDIDDAKCARAYAAYVLWLFVRTV